MKSSKLRIKYLIVSLWLMLPSLSFSQPTVDSSSIQKTLDNMAAAWNRCDIPAFMHAYEDSANTMYVSNKGIVQGYPAIKVRYLATYPNCSAMGKLSLKILKNYFLSPTYAVTIGHWNLVRGQEKNEKILGGLFSLVFKKGEHGWHIIVDHTC